MAPPITSTMIFMNLSPLRIRLTRKTLKVLKILIALKALMALPPDVLASTSPSASTTGTSVVAALAVICSTTISTYDKITTIPSNTLK
jgi:hypothetical protein